MNYARLAAALVLLLAGIFIGIKWSAADVVAAEKALSDYKASVLQQITQQQAAAMQQAKQAAIQQAHEDQTHARQLATLQADNDRLANRLRTERVHVCTIGPEPLPAAGESPGGRPDPAARTDLHPAAGSDLVRLARDADQIAAALRVCLAGYP